MENLVPKNKKRRIEEDRISVLPDSLLIHILSFLPAKYAVATCLLSKRWRRLWRHVTALDLRPGNFNQLGFFGKFVDKMLKLVDLKFVKKFVLDCSGWRPLKRSNKWIDVMISWRIEHLEIHLDHGSQYELASCIFLSNNLRVLKLSFGRVNTLSRVKLPSLQVLHLKDVMFQDFTSMEILINACCSLKDLVIGYMFLMDFRPLKIERLNHLVTVDVSPQSLIPFAALSNVKYLRIHQCSGKDIWSCNHNIPIFPNLTHLNCYAFEWTKLVNCLEKFPKLQKLVVAELGSSSRPVPIVKVPSCVSFHLKEFTLLYSKGSENESKLLRFMMKNARALRTISICAGNCEYKPSPFRKLAAFLRSDSVSERCSQVHEEPVLFMVY